MSSDEASSGVTYISISSDYEEPSDVGSPRVVIYGYDGLPMHPIDPPSPDYEVLVEDQPYAAADSPIALSSGYIADLDLEEDPKDESGDGPTDYPADRGDDDDSLGDDADDKDEEEASEEDEDEEEEEEYLASSDSTAAASPVVDPVPSAEEIEPFEIDESAATPPPPLVYCTTARMSIRAQTPIPFPSEEEVDRLLAIPTPPPSPLTSLSSPLPRIPSPPFSIPSPPTTSPTYTKAPLGYRAARIRLRTALPPPLPLSSPLPLSPPIILPRTRASMVLMRVAAPSTYILSPQSRTPPSGTPPILPIPLRTSSLALPLPSTDRRADVPEVVLPPQKRLCIAPGPRFKVKKCSSAAAAMSARGLRADYGFVGTLYAKIRHDPNREIVVLQRTEDQGTSNRLTQQHLQHSMTALESFSAQIGCVADALDDHEIQRNNNLNGDGSQDQEIRDGDLGVEGEGQKEFRKRFSKIRIKEIKCPEGLDFEEFGALHEGIALQNLNQFRHVSYEQDDRRFTSQAWNRLFRIKEQLGGERRSMTMRQFIQDLGRHSGKEKVTLDDIFLLHSMDGGVSVDVPWHVAKIASYYGLMTLGAFMNVTLGPETSSKSVAKLVDWGIRMYNGLGIGEMVAEIPEVVGDNDDGARQAEIGGVGCHPNMSNANRLRAMDERPREIVNDVNELTYVVLGMFEQYDQFYREFRQWKTEQERFISWNTDHLSKFLAHHHIDHTRYDGSRYSYVPNIPDLGVQQGVNFMSGNPGYSTAPSPLGSQFGMFGDAHPSTSRNQDAMNED
ncbi:hypothetical protein Tco_0927017 [Tanacetum coccineum]|uniref:Uncharacterized protein n=1 Tax=Tanacetum coccineum TaxID=301880 RepID=A0ABQ5DE64_9ASTR